MNYILVWRSEDVEAVQKMYPDHVVRVVPDDFSDGKSMELRGNITVLPFRKILFTDGSWSKELFPALRIVGRKVYDGDKLVATVV